MGRGIPRPLLHLALLLSLLWLPQAIPKVDVKGPCGSMKSRILRGRQAGGLHSKQAFERETMLPETLRGCLLPRQGVLVLRGGEPMDDDWTGAGPGARTESKQSRKLQLQKARWKRKYRGVDDDESTGLSSEDERHEDRPDVYKPPIEAPPPDDWNPMGILPAWMDPIYDEVDPAEYGLGIGQNGNDECAPPSSLSTVSDGFYYNESTKELVLTNHKHKGAAHDTDMDKEMTFSELEEACRIHGVPEWVGEAMEEDPPFDEMPDSFEHFYGVPREEAGLLMPYTGSKNQVFAAMTAQEGGGEVGMCDDDGGGGCGAKVDEGAVAEPLVSSPGQTAIQVSGMQGGGKGELTVRGEDDGGMFFDVPDEGAKVSERVLYNLPEGVELVKHNIPGLGECVAGSIDTREGGTDGTATICAPDKHPLDYTYDSEAGWEESRPPQFAEMFRGFDWSKCSPSPMAERNREFFMKRFGFLPDWGKEIPGYNAWNTTLPIPLEPPVMEPEKEHLIVPDGYKTFPIALWRCEDGDTIFVRRGNHTWLGRTKGNYNILTMNGENWSEDEIEQLIGFAIVPPEGLSRATIDPARTHLLDHVLSDVNGVARGEGGVGDTDSFCLHVTGEQGARLCGRWLMRPHSCGSVKGIECIVQINETTVEENAAQCLCATVEVQGGPWLFQGAALRSCGAIAIQCSRRSLAKCRGCVIGGVSHDRLMQAIAGKAMMGMQARDFARVVVEETTFEMTGLMFMPAARFIGKSRAYVDSCLIQRSTHAFGLLDLTEVRLNNCTAKEMNQGVLWCQERIGEVTGGQPEDEQASGEVGLREHDLMKELCGTGQEVYWDDCRDMYVTSRPKETVRIDPLFGNLTDGWTRGLPGWTNGVPQPVKAGIDVQVDVGGSFMSEISDDGFKWWQVGCIESRMIANGTKPGDVLAHCFTGGGHESTLHATNCTFYGRLWSTSGRPAKYQLRQVSNPRDPWIDKYVGNMTERGTNRQVLERVGMKWDSKRRTYRKPVRMVNGTIVFVDWNETRFQSDGAPGGYPGSRGDYPMYHSKTFAKLDPIVTCSTVRETREFPGLNDRIDALPPEAQNRLARLQKKAARRLREEADFVGPDFHERDPSLQALGAMDPEKQKDLDIRRLIKRYLDRKARKEEIFNLDDADWHLLDDQDHNPQYVDEWTLRSRAVRQ